MLQELRPLLKLLRWIRFIDRIHKGPKTEFISRDYVEASRSLAEPNASKQLWLKVQATNNDYEGVHPDIVDFWKAMFKHMKRRNIPVRAFEFVRSPERQEELFQSGRSKAQAGFSPHQYGYAVDIIHATRAWNLTKKEWDVVGSIGKEIARKRKIDIEWGGDWKFYDPAHWQLKTWKALLH